MASVTAIREAVAGRLDTIDGLTGSAEAPGQVNIPAAIVLPGKPLIVYGARMGNKPDINLVIVLLVALADTQLSQSIIDPYLDDTGAQSIRAAVNGSLGGLASIARITEVRDYGTVSYSGTAYLGAELLLAITAR